MTASMYKRLPVVLVLVLFSAGCGLFTGKKLPPPCPPTFILKDAGAMTRYKPGGGKDITDVLFQAKILDFRGMCDYSRDRKEVDIELELTFEMLRGPANRDRKVAFDYFVAIPHFHPKPQGKSTLAIAAEFPGTGTRFRTKDKVELVIPLDRNNRWMNTQFISDFN